MAKKNNLEKKKANPLAAAGLAILIIIVIVGVPIWWELNNGPINPVVIASRTPAGIVAVTDTAIPLPTDTPSPSDWQSALRGVEPEREILQAEAFEIAQTVQIVFMMGQDLAGAEAFMLDALCAMKGYIPDGYRVRFAGDRGDSIEVMTATVDNTAIVALACPPSVDFESITSEYHVAEGLR